MEGTKMAFDMVRPEISVTPQGILTITLDLRVKGKGRKVGERNISRLLTSTSERINDNGDLVRVGLNVFRMAGKG